MKLKSTAQQEVEKKIEREKKLKMYVTARDACFTKVWVTRTQDVAKAEYFIWKCTECVV